ncbi:MarR family transcriptional regulator [Natrarchaeobius halalkaliphilus]|uniref:MarR family transcriptional regulator n=1 Tax=Natrarchaeobius halalkaliphilus TaxID=1679091 RepID=A0A3N6P9L4_9EURY|nr:MarR family transcriptional regulator [Natrarchaeobius halalkaliphilus]RQG92935.1 MarR family transcriptional regulator [Natrarchaeobius halalkaliphilus]
MEQQLTTDRSTVIPTELDSPQGKLVYLYLDATSGATLTDLNRTLAMNKMSILSVLDTLSSDALVEKRGDEYVTIPAVE